MPGKGLIDSLQNGGNLIVAEGYLFEFERRGYLTAGTFTPEVVLDHPHLVKQLHEEYVHAGSDVVLAFTYYAHREKMRLINREDELEKINSVALKIARQVADDTGTLMAGNICNTTIYDPKDPKQDEYVTSMFKEQIEWAVAGGADFVVGETFGSLGESLLALDAIKKYGNGLPAVITLASPTHDLTYDGFTYAEAGRRLEDAGAAVVGLNCSRGPLTILPLAREMKQSCKGPIAALPVPYRCTAEFPTMQSIKDPATGVRAFPIDLPAWICSRTEIKKFAEEAKEIGVQYVGLCCGSSSHSLRIVAEVYDRNPPASQFSPDMSKHFMYGNLPQFTTYNTEGAPVQSMYTNIEQLLRCSMKQIPKHGVNRANWLRFEDEM